MIKKPKDRAIIFSSDMVNAIIAGRKTQTRRIVKPLCNCPDFYDYRPQTTYPYFFRRKDGIWDSFGTIDQLCFKYCPHGYPGSHLWVKEAWAESEAETIIYKADQPFGYEHKEGKWKSPIYMPKSASRITLKIKSVRIKKLQDISKEDAIAEGVIELLDGAEVLYVNSVSHLKRATRYQDPIMAFRSLWQSIHGADSWYQNPLIWRICFEKVSGDIV